MSLPTTGAGPSALGEASKLLDGVSDLQAVYSVRKLLTAYAGECLRIRRASDDGESDFGFDGAGDLDVASIATFLAATTGSIVTWYDQSGNTNDAVQATDAEQPPYVASGINSLPTVQIEFNADKWLDLPDAVLASLAACTFFAVADVTGNAESGEHCLLGMWDDGNNERQFQYRLRGNASGHVTIHYGGTVGNVFAESSNNYTFTDPHVYVGKASNGAALQMYVDGTEVSGYSDQDNAVTLIAAFTLAPAIGRRASSVGTNQAECQIPEMIIVGAALSDGDRNAIEADQASYFGI